MYPARALVFAKPTTKGIAKVAFEVGKSDSIGMISMASSVETWCDFVNNVTNVF